MIRNFFGIFVNLKLLNFLNGQQIKRNFFLKNRRHIRGILNKN